MQSLDRTQLNAIYYPYSMCIYEIALKRLLLVFDTVGFIYPHSSGFTLNHPGYLQAVWYVRDSSVPILPIIPKQAIGGTLDMEKWKEVFVALEKEGMVSAIDPKPIVDKNDELLTYAALIDSRNSDFISLLNEAINRQFVERFSSEESHLFGRAVHWGQDPVDSLFGWRIGMRGVPITLKKIWFEEKEKVLEQYSGFGVWELHKNMPLNFDDEGLYFIRPKYAASLAMNRALVASVQLGMPLVTDNPLFQVAISQKVSSILKFANEPNKEASIIASYLSGSTTFPERFRKVESERLVSIVLQNIVSDEALKKMSLEKLVEYKKKSSLERERLLSTAYQWAYEVEDVIKSGQGDGIDFSEKVYKTKVLPEINRYRETLAKLDRKLVPSLLSSAAEGLGISLTATTVSSLLAGLTLEKTLVLGIVISAPLIGKSIKQVLDYKIERADKQGDSPVTYLLNAK